MTLTKKEDQRLRIVEEKISKLTDELILAKRQLLVVKNQNTAILINQKGKQTRLVD